MLSQQDLPVGLARVGQPSEVPPVSGLFSRMNFQSLVYPSETPLFVACALFSAFVYLPLLLYSLVALFMTPVVFVAVLMLVPLTFLSHGLMVGYLRGNAIRVSTHQFPEIYAAAERISQQMGMPVPIMYIIESGGLLNAFATRLLMRDYVVLYSDVVEIAYEQGQPAVNFVVAHELAHVRRGHLKWRWLIAPAAFLPTLSNAYYRACEYTCDKMAAFAVPDGAVSGILALSAGKKLYKHVNVRKFAAQQHEEGGFWTWLAELFSTHPHHTKRLNALLVLPFVQEPTSA